MSTINISAGTGHSGTAAIALGRRPAKAGCLFRFGGLERYAAEPRRMDRGLSATVNQLDAGHRSAGLDENGATRQRAICSIYQSSGRPSCFARAARWPSPPSRPFRLRRARSARYERGGSRRPARPHRCIGEIITRLRALNPRMRSGVKSSGRPDMDDRLLRLSIVSWVFSRL